MEDNKYYKWNEITCRTMREIFTSFAKREDWTLDKVLEIQDPIAISENNHNTRMYLGSCINISKFRDFPEPFLDVFDIIAKKEGIDNVEDYLNSRNDYLSICILNKNIPIIIPLFYKKKQYKNILLGCFGDPIVNEDEEDLINDGGTKNIKWYIKDKRGNRILDVNKDSYKKYNDTEKFIRTRVIDGESWYNDIIEFAKEGKDTLHTDNDLIFLDLDIMETKKEGD